MSKLYSNNTSVWWLVSLLGVGLLLSSSSPGVVVVAHFPHDNCDGLEVSPIDDGKEVFVVNRGTLLRSLDCGQTWEYIVRELPGNPTNTYLALSPYNDKTLYVYNGGTMWRSSNNFIEWEEITSSPLSLNPCQKYYYKTLKKRTTFTKTYGALIAGEGNVLYKQNGRVFDEVYNDNFNNCPSLAGVLDSDTVYAGGSNGLMRSDDGGQTWSLIVSLANIIEVEVNDDGKVFVMTTTGICYLNETTTNNCIDIELPKTSVEEKVRDGQPSPPTSISYHNNVLYVTRANSYAIYMSTDYINKVWTFRSKKNDDNFVTSHVGGNIGWDFAGVEEFTHVMGGYIGTWLGLFKTDDDGNSWTYRETITNAITSLSLSKATNGKFTLALGTYAGGTYLGTPNDLKPAPKNFVKSAYYRSLILSPSYDDDGIAFERGERHLYRFDTGKAIVLNPIDVNEPIRIKGVVFSPTFAIDDTIFVVGYNLGIIVSYDKGETFTRRLFDGRAFSRVYRLVISPNFYMDGTMACMIDPNFDNNDWQLDNDIQYIYLSNDYGISWRRLVWTSRPFRDIIIVTPPPVDDDETETTTSLPIVVAIDNEGRMYARSSDLSDWFPFRSVSGTAFPAVRPLGFANDGLAVSPNGQRLAAAWREGAIMYGEISLHTILNRTNSYPGPWAAIDIDEQQPVVFGRSPGRVPDVQGRMLTSHIIFSPEYEKDNIIVAADMFSVYMSYNQGKTFMKVFTL